MAGYERKQMTQSQNILPPIEQALIEKGYNTLTPVQESMLDPELGEQDALVSAQTGSGKTVAFGLALAPTLLGGAHKFDKCESPLGLIIAPTRELALQVKRELAWLYEKTGASIASCIGGMDMRTERRDLARGAHIVVGTPGRLRDHIERGSLATDGLRAVVLDEADEMLDLGFREDLEFILDTTPQERRTLMFSATVSRSIASLAKRYQRDAVRITTIGEQAQHKDIDYLALTVAPNDQENAIINVLRFYEARNTIIFCSTRATVNHMTARFQNRGFSVVALSGELSQKERSHALQAMRDGRARVCIATDVAARGIDLPGLELVIHADVPKTKESLLHRSGRTGRAGARGVSALIVPVNRRRGAQRLLEAAEIQANWTTPPTIEEILERDRERFLDDPILKDPIAEEELEFVQVLKAHCSPEQLAAALVRARMGSKPAPEELLPTDRKPNQEEKFKANFKDGVWIGLSIGRNDRASPSWLVPMLCRKGHITKKDIGAIRIKPNETHIELSSKAAAKLLQTISGTGELEEGVLATVFDAPPVDDKPKTSGPKSSRPKSSGPKSSGQRPSGPKSQDESASSPTRTSKPKKKPHKKKLAKAAARGGKKSNNATPRDTGPKKKRNKSNG